MQKKILIVEDNELNRAVLCEILSDTYQVLEAKNGQEALDILCQRKDSVALILLDVMMPVMDGYTFLGRIKVDPELSTIPVIVMTQSDSEIDEVTALAHGATDFVPKPYRPQVILHRIASLIKLRETAAMVTKFTYDRLTGLYSKGFFCQMVREQLEQHPDREYALICSNVENFKLYNDAFGIQEGDRLLKELAVSIQSAVGESGICGRYRADRFFFLQEQTPGYRARISTGEGSRFGNIAQKDNIVIKWGIYEIIDPAIPVELMCDRALLAVDSIKGQYDNQYAVYDDALREKLLREKAITDAMETAVAENQFTIYLQPKYSLNSDCLAGAEALVRWSHPKWGFLSPGEFIPLFEKNGFISKLDWAVWEWTCIQLSKWKEKGYPLFPVSVNVSRSDMLRGNLAEMLLRLTQRYDIDPAYLHLEITESAYSEHPERIISTVEELRSLGFVIEMDDFGSGYSSLNMLSQMQLDILKLDMGFIQNEIAKSIKQSILSDVIAMAHRLNLTVVAEGVETREQMERLGAVGCDYAQGYFFAKPMPLEEFEKLLRQWKPPMEDLPEVRKPDVGMSELLVVVEDSEYRERIREEFQDYYHIWEAAEAESALRCIRSQEAGGISAVLVSVTLPENGAATVLKELRQFPAYWQVPVLTIVPSGECVEEFPLARETDDFLCKCHPMFDLRRRIQRLVDITTLRRREHVLRNEANQDALTGLLNRRGLQSAMVTLRETDLPFAVYLFDLDGLKKTNDTFGHDAGDRLILAFAALLQRCTRSGDILCRYGGDEFLVVLQDVSSIESILKKGESICRLFQDYQLPDGSHAACSGGIVWCAANEVFSQETIMRADVALYRAKQESKGTCRLWEADGTVSCCAGSL